MKKDLLKVGLRAVTTDAIGCKLIQVANPMTTHLKEEVLQRTVNDWNQTSASNTYIYKVVAIVDVIYCATNQNLPWRLCSYINVTLLCIPKVFNIINISSLSLTQAGADNWEQTEPCCSLGVKTQQQQHNKSAREFWSQTAKNREETLLHMEFHCQFHLETNNLKETRKHHGNGPARMT